MTVTFILSDGTRRDVAAATGETLLSVAQSHGLDLEGSCGGCLSCCTCHVVVAPDDFERLPPPEVEEDDMLDLAAGVTETSRLGCQIALSEELDGIVVRIPGAARARKGH